MITFTLIRHGESTDNIRPIWAGWKDAPLSNHGMNQAAALGASLASTPFAAIHASTLQRALSTARAGADAQDPHTPLTTSPLLREQNYGAAQGHPVAARTDVPFADAVARGVYPFPPGRTERFPGGESADDLRRRAAAARDELLLPHVWAAARAGKDAHVAVVSHGILIAELIAALVERGTGAPAGAPSAYRGLRNTAWARVTVGVQGARPGEPVEFHDKDLPPLVVRLTDFNRGEHLEGIVRQKGGIGSTAHDPRQKDIRAFFGGGPAAVDE